MLTVEGKMVKLQLSIEELHTIEYILDRVIAERAAQIHKFGEQHHSPERWLTILTEEVGEVARSILKQKPGEQDMNMITELVQVAAVAAAFIEDLESGK